MGRSGYALIGLALAALAAVLAGPRLLPAPPAPPTPASNAETGPAPASTAGTGPAAAPPAAGPTLYCEFTNFADRNPRVGFYFAIQEARRPPVYAQIFQRERDGTQADFGADGAARPEWAFDGSADPAVLSAPDGATAINLYGYDAARTGTTWFEAGLRSIRYLNLGGRCRRTAG